MLRHLALLQLKVASATRTAYGGRAVTAGFADAGVKFTTGSLR